MYMSVKNNLPFRVFSTTLLLLVLFSVPRPVHAITIQEEEEIAVEFLASVFNHYQVVDDPYITEYINRIGQRIVRSMPIQPLDYHFYVIAEPSFNAFAGPGAHIFINSGLITALKSEEELAGIVSHEIAHVSSRHISTRIERAKKIQIGSLLGMIAGALVAASNPKEGTAIINSTMAASQAAMLAFSREHEMQADHLGYVAMVNAGYSGSGFVSALETMRKSQVYDMSQVPTYLLTHPSSDERVAYMRSVLKYKDSNPDDIVYKSGDEYAIIQTWITGMLESVENAEKKFDDRIKKNEKDHLAYYGAALVMSRKNHSKKSIELLEKALSYDLMNSRYREELGKQYFISGEIRKSVELLEYMDTDDVQSRFYLARGNYELSRYDEAIHLLERIVATDKKHDEALYYLGLSYGSKGDKDLAHYYLGLHYIVRRDKENAEFHLEKAIKLLSDPEKKKIASQALKSLTEKKKKKKK